MMSLSLECEKYSCDSVNEFYFSYRLFRCKTENGEVIFSLLVSLFENGKFSDERFVFDISRKENDAEKIFDIICKNYVTPYALDECLDSIFDMSE